MKIILSFFLLISFSLQQEYCDTPGQNDTCVKCFSGYFLNQTQTCERCFAYCSNCENSTSCTKCDEFHLLNEESTQCLGCSTKFPECKTCSNTDCLTCNAGFFLTQGECKACSDKWVNCNLCTESECTLCNASSCREACDSNQIYTNDFCIDCKNFIPNCEKCSQTDECDECDEFHFVDSNKQQCTECSKGVNFCEKCDSSTRCSKCFEGYLLQNSICSSGSFESTYYDDNTLTNMPCYSKFEQCEYCTSTRCISCFNPFKLEDTKCVPRDSSVSTAFDENGTQVPCSEKFKGCNYCTRNGCIGCFNSDLIDSTGNCVNDCSVSNCSRCSRQKCVECESDMFVLTDEKCSSCSSIFNGCIRCSNQRCLQCNGDYSLINDKCVTKQDEDDGSGFTYFFLIVFIIIPLTVCSIAGCYFGMQYRKTRQKKIQAVNQMVAQVKQNQGSGAGFNAFNIGNNDPAPQDNIIQAEVIPSRFNRTDSNNQEEAPVVHN